MGIHRAASHSTSFTIMYAYLLRSKHSFVESFMSFPVMDVATTSTKYFSRFSSINGVKASFPAPVASKSDEPYTNMFTCNPFIPENGPVGSKKLETASLSGSKWPPRAVHSLELPNLAARGAHFEPTIEMLPS
ncbi:hypothetical protein NC652_007843 [Populus alba x Populus x berolinensis]|nr:hypothetical protein NC652_007843 [Populus alba x Populus x berolinensis]